MLSVITVIIEFAYAHPFLTTVRIGFAIALMVGLFSYHRLYNGSKRAARLNAELIENLSEGVYRSSPEGKQLSANRALVKLNGYNNEAELLAAVKDIATEWYVDPNRRSEFKEILLRDGRVEDFISEVRRHKTGEKIWVSESARLVRDDKTGEIICYEGSVRDISDSIQRMELEDRFRKLTDLLPGGLFQLVRNPDGSYAAPYVTSGFCRTVGIRNTQSVSDPGSYFSNLHPDDRETYLQSLELSSETLQTWSCEFRIVKNTGETRWLHVIAQPEISNSAITWHGYVSDVTERKQQELRIAELAYYDPLTKLPNRRVMIERMTQTASECRRHGQHSALLYIDLDRFKELNDSYGHDVGDLFLIEVAQRLRSAVRIEDTVARIGGDEFVVILKSMNRDHTNARKAAEAAANNILKKLRRPYELGPVRYNASASIGAVTFDGSDAQVDDVLKRADLAMYEVKSGLRDGVALGGDQLDIDSNGEVSEMGADLKKAISNRQLQLYFQPQVDRKGLVVGAEALLRWPHSVRGMVLPDRFVPLAASLGLSAELDLLAIEMAVESLAKWKAHPAAANLRLAVNMRTSTLLDGRTPARIRMIIKQHEIQPGMLTLEVTEQGNRPDRIGLQEQMAELKDLGIRFSLDDFGSGYSSITYLKQLPFDEVKIEGAFITEIDGTDNDGALVKTILAMAGTLGLTAVAEHVESEQQEAFLRAYGCDVFQGYLYAGAMTNTKFLEFTEANSSTIRRVKSAQEPPLKIVSG